MVRVLAPRQFATAVFKTKTREELAPANGSLTGQRLKFNECRINRRQLPLCRFSGGLRGSMMNVPRDEPLVDDLVLGVWAVIALLGAARECDDTADMSGLVSKAEQVLSAVIPHLAALALTGPSASMPGSLH